MFKDLEKEDLSVRKIIDWQYKPGTVDRNDTAVCKEKYSSYIGIYRFTTPSNTEFICSHGILK